MFYKQNTNTGRCQLLFPRPLAFSHTAPVPLCPHLSTHGIVNLSPAECADAFESNAHHMDQQRLLHELLHPIRIPHNVLGLVKFFLSLTVYMFSTS